LEAVELQLLVTVMQLEAVDQILQRLVIPLLAEAELDHNQIMLFQEDQEAAVHGTLARLAVPQDKVMLVVQDKLTGLKVQQEAAAEQVQLVVPQA
jgi:hypothetical protein